jgi:hypothetical protein
MEHVAPGVKRHYPPATPVQRGSAVDPLPPVPLSCEGHPSQAAHPPRSRPPRPSEVLRAAGRRTRPLWPDGTEGPW